MELDLQLTPRSRILLAILGGVLLILLVVQVGPAFYRVFANQDAQVKQEQLLKTKNLVNAAEMLKPIEPKIYEDTGLAVVSNRGTVGQPTATLFDTGFPETVIRSRIDALVRRAGIQQNYQLLTKPVPAKQTQTLTMENRGNLVLYHYLKHIEAEEAALIELSEQQADDDGFEKLMGAWLSGIGEDDPIDSEEAEPEEPATEETERPIEGADAAESLEFAALPEVIPLWLRVQLAGVIKDMLARQLRGAAASKQDFFDTQLHKVRTPATPGVFGIGAKPATVEIQLRSGAILTELLAQAVGEEGVDIVELQYALIGYIEGIQQKRATLLAHLELAPSTYQTEHYTVEMKFKTEIDKLVNLNHLIETGAKWLQVRDLRISADTQQANARGRNSQSETALNVDMLLIARIF